MNNCPGEKVCFTKRQARQVLNNIDYRKQYRKESRMYYCDYCNAWHLTSKPLGSTKEYNIKLKLKNKFKKYLSK